jgi:pilus assembly protein Flp/PilA
MTSSAPAGTKSGGAIPSAGRAGERCGNTRIFARRIAPLDGDALASDAGRRSIMKNTLNRFATETDGQDLIEYGMLIGIIAVGVIAVVTSIGGKVLTYFTDLDTALPAKH